MRQWYQFLDSKENYSWFSDIRLAPEVEEWAMDGTACS